jgi:hypothetical protein
MSLLCQPSSYCCQQRSLFHRYCQHKGIPIPLLWQGETRKVKEPITEVISHDSMYFGISLSKLYKKLKAGMAILIEFTTDETVLIVFSVMLEVVFKTRALHNSVTFSALYCFLPTEP